jgi:hypothetical protein
MAKVEAMSPNSQIATRAVARRIGPYLVAGAVAATAAMSLAGSANGAPAGPETVDRTVISGTFFVDVAC